MVQCRCTKIKNEAGMPVHISWGCSPLLYVESNNGIMLLLGNIWKIHVHLSITGGSKEDESPMRAVLLTYTSVVISKNMEECPPIRISYVVVTRRGNSFHLFRIINWVTIKGSRDQLNVFRFYHLDWHPTGAQKFCYYFSVWERNMITYPS